MLLKSKKLLSHKVAIMKTITIAFATTILLSQAGCSILNNDPCEDITFSSEQQAECTNLHKQIVNAKGNPIKRTELERRYQENCVDIRYYRDDQTNERCGNKESIEKAYSDEKNRIEANKK